MTHDEDTETMTQVALRLPEELLERVKQHHQRLRTANPGMAVSRADAFRSLLSAALDRVEAKPPTRRRGG